MTRVEMLKQTFHPDAGGPVDVGQEVTIPNELADHWELQGIAETIEKLGEDSGRKRRPQSPAAPQTRPPVRSVRPQVQAPAPPDEESAKEKAPAKEWPCRSEGCDRVLRSEFGRDSHEKSHKGFVAPDGEPDKD